MTNALKWAGWNLFLAFIPVALAHLLAWGWYPGSKKRRLPAPFGLALGVVWFLFLPNSCYLLTEWRHLLFDPKWMLSVENSRGQDHAAMLATAKSALLFLGYSGAGMLMFVLAIRPVERMLRAAGGRFFLFAPGFFFLISLGVYMGLIERVNSWDAFTHPAIVWEAIDDALFNRTVVTAVAVFGAILWALYEAVDLWVDGFRQSLVNMGLLRK
ncbi:MAG: DUF1361 domain-containing protein [Chthonomonadales bacterium]